MFTCITLGTKVSRSLLDLKIEVLETFHLYNIIVIISNISYQFNSVMLTVTDHGGQTHTCNAHIMTFRTKAMSRYKKRDDHQPLTVKHLF